jgi:hypothetical protein
MAQNILTSFERQLNSDAIDPSLNYELMDSSDTVSERKTVSIMPTSGSGNISGGGSSIIQFLVRSGDFVDLQSFHGTLDYTPTKVNMGTTGAEPPNGVELTFKECRLRSGTGAQLETIRKVGTLQHILQNYSMTNNHMETIHTTSGGGGGVKYRNNPDVTVSGGLNIITNDRMGASAGGTEKLSFIIPSQFMHSCSRYLDTGAMKGLIIEFEIEAPTFVFKSAVSDASVNYTLGNVQLHYDEINVSSAYKKMYLQKLAEGISIPYTTYTHSSAQGGDSVRISRSMSRLKDIITIGRVATTLDNQAVDSYLSKPYTDAGRWNYAIGSDIFPVSQVRSASQAYREALKVFARGRDTYSGSKSLADFKAGAAILAIDVEKSKGSSFDGISTTNNPDILLLSSGVFNSNDIVDTWLHHERILKISNGTVEVLE